MNHKNLGGLLVGTSQIQGWSGLVEQRGPQLPGLQVAGRLASGPSQQGGGEWGIPGLRNIPKTMENHHQSNRYINHGKSTNYK